MIEINKSPIWGELLDYVYFFLYQEWLHFFQTVLDFTVLLQKYCEM